MANDPSYRESSHTETISEKYVCITYEGKSFVGIQTGIGVGGFGQKYAMVLPHYIFMQDEVEEITEKEYFLGKLKGDDYKSTKY